MPISHLRVPLKHEKYRVSRFKLAVSRNENEEMAASFYPRSTIHDLQSNLLRVPWRPWRLGGESFFHKSALRGRIALPLWAFLRFKFGFGAFAAFGDEVVAGFAAEQGDGLVFWKVTRDAIEAAGFAVGEWGGIIDFPQDFFRALVGGSADLAHKFLRAIVADRAGEAVHTGLAVELVAQVLHLEVTALLGGE
jgi:hypothetical protein